MNVICVLVQGNVPFTTDYVVRLRSMVRRNLRQEHNFICLTDRPSMLPPSIITVEVDSPSGFPGWWSKLEIFNPKHCLYGDSIYVDLDVLVVDSLDPVAEFESDLALIPHEGTFEGRGGRAVIKKYNSSVMRLKPERHHQLYTAWSPEVTGRLWGDQDWIAERLPSQPTMPLHWFPRLSQIQTDGQQQPRWPDDSRVILCKKPKNHDAVHRWEWFNRVWQ